MATLNTDDVRILTEAGFTMKEIKELNKATDPKGNPQPDIDLSSPAWQAAIGNRASWTARIRRDYEVIHGVPLNKYRYELIVDQWYKAGVRKSPWDWLKITYQPRRKTDFMTAAKSRIQKQQDMLRSNGFRIGKAG